MTVPAQAVLYPSQRPVATFDLDGTLYRWSLALDLVDELASSGIIPADRLEPLQALRKEWIERRSTYTAFVERYVMDLDGGLLKGVSEVAFRQAAECVVARHGKRVYVFTRELLLACQGAGFATVAITGSPIHVAEIFCRQWRFDHVSATVEQTNDAGVFTGDRTAADIPAHRKEKELLRFVDLYGGHQSSIAIGDTIGDAPMLEKAEFPIAFNPDQELEKVAWEKSWPIAVERKNTVILLRHDLRCKVETIMPRKVAIALRNGLVGSGITLRP